MGVFESKEEFRWGQKYELIDIDNNDKVLKLMSRVGEHEYIGKEYLCQNFHEIQRMEMLIDHKILKPSPFLMRLKRAATKNKNGACSISKLFYLVFEKPFQTLKEECIARRIKGERLRQQQLDCILEAAVKALYYLKDIGESHRNISSSSIFIREDRTVILSDPWVLGHPNSSNYNDFTYPSPEKILFENHLIQAYNYLLSDLFSLGVVLLECLCLQHMDGLYQKGFRRIRYTNIMQKINLISNQRLRLKLKVLLDHDPSKRNQVFRLCDRKQPLKTSFISHQKEQFKRHYVLSHLETSEIKTIKPNQDDLHTIINKINESRDQSEVSALTEPKTHALRPFPIAPSTQTHISHPYYHLPQQNIHPIHNNMYSRQTVPNIAQNTVPSQLFLVNNFPNVLNHYPAHPSIKFNHQHVTENEINKNIEHVKQPQQHFHEKMSLSSIHQNSSRESEQISNIQIITEPRKEEKKIYQLNQPIIHMQNEDINQKQEIKQLGCYQIAEKPAEKEDTHLNVQKHMRMNSTIKQLSDESPSREDIDLVTGQHEIYYQTGTRYKGNIKNGKRDGVGTFFYKDGCFYWGEWSQNKMHGKGKLYSQNEKLIYDGNWYMDSFHGSGLLFNLDPVPLSFPFDYHDLTNIEEIWQEYKGDFFWDKKHGKGSLTLTNGEVYEGMFDNNQVHGQGKYYKIGGQIINGVWQSGILTEKG